MKNALLIIITALVIGGGTYWYVNSKATNDKTALQTTINALNENVASLQGQLTNAQVNVNADTNTNTPTATAACTSTNLAVTLSDGQGTAGVYYYTLGLKNTGVTSCVYSGTTKISLLNAAGTALENHTLNTSDLTIQGGGSIYAAVGFPNKQNYADADACQTGVTTLSITPPGQASAVKMTNLATLQPGWTNYACQGLSVGQFSTTKP